MIAHSPPSHHVLPLHHVSTKNKLGFRLYMRSHLRFLCGLLCFEYLLLGIGLALVLWFSQVFIQVLSSAQLSADSASSLSVSAVQSIIVHYLLVLGSALVGLFMLGDGLVVALVKRHLHRWCGYNSTPSSRSMVCGVLRAWGREILATFLVLVLGSLVVVVVFYSSSNSLVTAEAELSSTLLYGSILFAGLFLYGFILGWTPFFNTFRRKKLWTSSLLFWSYSLFIIALGVLGHVFLFDAALPWLSLVPLFLAVALLFIGRMYYLYIIIGLGGSDARGKMLERGDYNA